MNKKGFTLVELLAVICILGVVMSVSIIAIKEIRKKMYANMTFEKIQEGILAAQKFGENNEDAKEVLTNLNSNECTVVKWSDLLDSKDYSSDEKDKSGNVIILNNVTKEDMKDLAFCIYKEHNRVYGCVIAPREFGGADVEARNYDILHKIQGTNLESLYCNTSMSIDYSL